jgi:hypothetical protein
MVWLKGLVVTLVVVAAVWVALLVLGHARWQTATQALVEQMAAARTPMVHKRYDPRELQGLPPPVQRYFQTVLTPGQPLIEAVSLEHAGQFNLSAEGQQWRPFRSRQWVTLRRPGFVWHGQVALAPGLPVHVHDAYVAGEGILKPQLLGWLTLADLHDMGGEVARGEFLRFLAEAAWYPTALLPSQGARWSAVDEHRAQVTISDGEGAGAVAATMTFRFNAQGLIESARAESRGRTVGGQVIPTPWEGRWSDYAQRDGMWVPLRGEVAWIAAGERQAYWRGDVAALRYEWAK